MCALIEGTYPAVRGGRPRTDSKRAALLAHVHDGVAKLAELCGVLHGLGEEVREVVVRADVGHLDLEGLDHVAHDVRKYM